MSEVTWFKVLTDIFSDDKIKILQSMPEGDSLLVMWFKVLSQAGKTNDGGYIYLKKNIPYTTAMFATLFGKQQQLVEFAMRTFSEFGMIDIDDKGYVFVTNWEKHQSVDKLERIKEKTKLRVQNHREKKKLELQGGNATVTLQVTHGNATEIDKDLELEKESLLSAAREIACTKEEEPINYYNAHKKAFGFYLNPRQNEILGAYIDQDGMQEAVIIRAVERAAEKMRGPYRFGLIETIVKGYLTAGAKTIEIALALDEEFDKGVNGNAQVNQGHLRYEQNTSVGSGNQRREEGASAVGYYEQYPGVVQRL